MTGSHILQLESAPACSPAAVVLLCHKPKSAGSRLWLHCAGWTYEMKNTQFPIKEKGNVKIHLVPYSEHSSYTELREYVRWLRPAQVRF